MGMLMLDINRRDFDNVFHNDDAGFKSHNGFVWLFFDFDLYQLQQPSVNVSGTYIDMTAYLTPEQAINVLDKIKDYYINPQYYTLLWSLIDDYDYRK